MPKPKQSRKIKNAGRQAKDTRYIGPTDAREGHNEFERAGVALRVKDALRGLLNAKEIDQDQFDRLDKYRQQAIIADRSLVKCGIDYSVRASAGNGPSMIVTSAKIETSRMEKAMGQLAKMVRAILVEDKTIRQWCMDEYGTIENGGRIRPVNEVSTRKRTIEELQDAAGLI